MVRGQRASTWSIKGRSRMNKPGFGDPAKHKRTSLHRVKQRSDPQPVPAEEQRVPPPVSDSTVKDWLLSHFHAVLHVSAEDHLGITGSHKAVPAAEQVLIQLLRVENAESGNSTHKYTQQQKMQGALRCGEHPCFFLSVYCSPAVGLILRLCRPDEYGTALERSTDGTALPQAGTGGASRLREHLRARFVRLILLKLFVCRGRL